MSPQHAKVAIIGTGPAGYTAAIYAARAGLKPVVIDGTQPGGQLTTTTDVENYPGFPDGVMGPEMMDLFRKQAARFGAEYVSGYVDSVDFKASPFTLRVDDKPMTADAVIVCTGASAMYLGLESEQKLLGYGVSACATCDGFFYRDKHVIVVGGGDTAMEEATFLTRFASKVTIVHRRDVFRASKIMQARALENDKIEVAWNSQVVDVHGDPNDGGVTGVTLEDTQNGERRELKCDGMFVAIGHKPNTDPFKEWLTTDDLGYIQVNAGSTKTNIEGVFAAGDAADKVYRQAVTAAGTGCMAAIDAERWLAEREG